MKVAQIVASLESRHGGPSRSVRGLSSAMAENGHTVGLLCTAPDHNQTIQTTGNLTTRFFPREWPQAFSVSAPLRSHLRSGGYEVFHHHGLWLRTLHYARCAAACARAPLVISPRGMMSPWAWNHHRLKKSLASRCIHPGAFASAAGWHATSEAEAGEIRALGFTQPICVAPNGVVAPSLADEVSAERHWHKLVPALAGRRVALFHSRLHAKKRVLELIDLWLSKSRGDWLLLIVGIPEQYTVNQLDAYLVRNGGTHQVVVQDGTHEPPPYAAASLFVLPTHSENFGLVIAEALVRGVPVLTTDGTPWQALDSQGAGRCVSWDNFGAALDTLLAASPEALRASGARARTWATRAFTWTQASATLAAFYASLRPAR
ncbi:MAG: glycosyltransferase [Opitutaceae bacterium]|nr:glycosyltransferase [Opitutaceae bacterium]